MCSCCVGCLECFGNVVGSRSEERAHIFVRGEGVGVENCDGDCDDADET